MSPSRPTAGRSPSRAPAPAAAEIYVADTRHSIARRLTSNAAADDVEPAWSPDGRRLAWVSGSTGSHDIYVMSRDGGGKRRLVEDPADDVEPAWSPDGSRIAFASNRDGRYQLWLPTSPAASRRCSSRRPGQSALRRGTRPDRLAYTGMVEGDADVWLRRSTASTEARLTSTPGFDGRPDWSPDGRRLAFVSNRGGSQRVWLMRADGSRQRPLESLGSR